MKAFIVCMLHHELCQKDLRGEVILARPAELKRHCMWSVLLEKWATLLRKPHL